MVTSILVNLRLVIFNFLLIFFVSGSWVNAQQSKVLVQNAKLSSPAFSIVEVKWYSQDFVYPQGVNVYRRKSDQANWVKLNTAPIMMSKKATPAMIKQDSDIQTFLDMANDLAKVKINGFALLTLFGKSFQSNLFSKLLGIQFDDDKVDWSSSYQYKIAKMDKGNEAEIGVSDLIVVGAYVSVKPVEGFTAKLEKKEVKLNWTPDANLFYGFNIYRSSSLDTATKKLNTKPIVLSEAIGNSSPTDALYVDKNIIEGTTYFYFVRGLDFFGGESQATKSIDIKIGDLTAPIAPQQIEAKVARNLQVRVTWQLSQDKDTKSYALYRSKKSDGPYTKVNTMPLLTDSVYMDNVTTSGFYYYYVSSVDAVGNEGASEKTLVEVKDIIPPSIPQGVAAKSDTGKIVLSWNRNRDHDLMGYYVYRSIKKEETASFVLVNVNPLKDTTYLQILPKNATNTFSFKVVATDSAYNKSEASEIVSAKMPDVIPPLKPIIRNIQVKNDSVFISWAANLEVDLAGYNLVRTGAVGHPTKINKQLINALSTAFVDTVKLTGRYQYQLTAIDKSGNESILSDPFPVDVQETFNFKFAKVNATFNKRAKTTSIVWLGTRNAKHLQGFVVFRKNEDQSRWEPISILNTNNSYLDKILVNKRTQVYQVRAYSTFGDVVVSDQTESK
jgi:uncharacterized protein